MPSSVQSEGGPPLPSRGRDIIAKYIGLTNSY